jgi:predicted alpha/beta superfamily hydrolase
MSKRIHITALATLALCRGGLAAQQLEPRSFPQQNVESWSYQSSVTGNKYDIVVGLPNGYRPGADRKYAALIVTDGYAAFPVANDAARSQMNQGVAEDLIVISVGSPLELGDSGWTRQRIWEFSPSGWDRTDTFGKEVTRTCGLMHSPPDRCSGGAPKFLEFIVSELLPRLEAKYAIDPERLGLFGVSAGGFFASWAIFQPNSPFRAYIIQSPAMAYGDGEIFRQEQRYAAEHKDLKVGIYLASGSLEMADPYLEGIGQIVSGQVRLAAALTGRHYPGLKLYTEILPGLSHGDAAGTALVRGIRLLYGKEQGTAPWQR